MRFLASLFAALGIISLSIPAGAQSLPLGDPRRQTVRGRFELLGDDALVCDAEAHCARVPWARQRARARGVLDDGAPVEVVVMRLGEDSSLGTIARPDGTPCQPDDAVCESPTATVVLVRRDGGALAGTWLESLELARAVVSPRMAHAPPAVWLEMIHPCMEECIDHHVVALVLDPNDPTRLRWAGYAEVGGRSHDIGRTTETRIEECSSDDRPGPPRFFASRDRVRVPLPRSGGWVELEWSPTSREFEETETRVGRSTRRCRWVRLDPPE